MEVELVDITLQGIVMPLSKTGLVADRPGGRLMQRGLALSKLATAWRLLFQTDSRKEIIDGLAIQ
jgi:hypothetical protein